MGGVQTSYPQSCFNVGVSFTFCFLLYVRINIYAVPLWYQITKYQTHFTNEAAEGLRESVTSLRNQYHLTSHLKCLDYLFYVEVKFP